MLSITIDQVHELSCLAAALEMTQDCGIQEIEGRSSFF